MMASVPSDESAPRRFRLLVVTISVVVAVVGSVLLAMRNSSAQTTTQGVTATLRVPGHPEAMIAGPNALWVALSRDPDVPAGDPRLLRLDLATKASAQPVYLGGEVSHLTRVGNRLVASVQHTSGLGHLATLDWSSGAVLVRRWFDGPIDQTVLRRDDLWALETLPARLLRLDSRTLEPTSAPLRLAAGRTLALTTGDGYLWVTAPDVGEVLRIDPASREIKRVHVGGSPAGITVTGGTVWFADDAGGVVRRLDPRSLQPLGDPIRVGKKPSGLVAAAGSLFVTDQDDGTVVRIDLNSAKKVGLPIRIAARTRDSIAPSASPAGQSVWVSDFASNTLNRIDSTAGGETSGGKVTVRISGMNKGQKGDRVTNGGVAGIGRFVASGAISETGKVVVYRTVKSNLITLRYVAAGSDGTITFVVKIDTNFGTSRWTIKSATKAYEGLHGEGVEKENADYTVSILSGTVSRSR
jgi:streptogramin lyase